MRKKSESSLKESGTSSQLHWDQPLSDEDMCKYMMYFKKPRLLEPNPSPTILRCVSEESYDDVPDSCKDELDKFFIINYLVVYQGSCTQNFKFLASQEVLRLLLVFDVSLKEAKMTFLISARMNLINFSSLIIQLCIKEAVHQISNSQPVRKYSVSYQSLMCL